MRRREGWICNQQCMHINWATKFWIWSKVLSPMWYIFNGSICIYLVNITMQGNFKKSNYCYMGSFLRNKICLNGYWHVDNKSIVNKETTLMSQKARQCSYTHSFKAKTTWWWTSFWNQYGWFFFFCKMDFSKYDFIELVVGSKVIYILQPFLHSSYCFNNNHVMKNILCLPKHKFQLTALTTRRWNDFWGSWKEFQEAPSQVEHFPNKKGCSTTF